MGRTKLSVVLILVGAANCLTMTYDELTDFTEYIMTTSQLNQTWEEGLDPNVDYDVRHHDDYGDDEVVSDHAWEESGKFEGDLILNEHQRTQIIKEVADESLISRNGVRHANRWPNNELIFHIQQNEFNRGQLQTIGKAMEELASATCIKFRLFGKGDRDAVVIQGRRKGCFSHVGYQGGYQLLNLCNLHSVGRGCFRHGTIVHELMHTLGFYHMQSSPDRDDYVNIVWENIAQPSTFNFRKYDAASASDFGVGYDYDSILHYSRRAFSFNGQDTIVPKQGSAEIGQRISLSEKDVKKLNKMYCDTNSDSNSQKKTETKKQKKRKNKPFEDHVTENHQGKGVKKLPANRTYKCCDFFDMFNKVYHFIKEL